MARDEAFKERVPSGVWELVEGEGRQERGDVLCPGAPRKRKSGRGKIGAFGSRGQAEVAVREGSLAERPCIAVDPDHAADAWGERGPRRAAGAGPAPEVDDH